VIGPSAFVAKDVGAQWCVQFKQSIALREPAFYRRDNVLRTHTVSFYANCAPALSRDNTKDQTFTAIVYSKENVKSEFISKFGWTV
jgi:hypothetical protein